MWEKSFIGWKRERPRETVPSEAVQSGDQDHFMSGRTAGKEDFSA